MAHAFAKIDQVSPALGEDAEWEGIYQNRGHALQTNSREGLIDQWTRDGRVFVANQPVLGGPVTMSATGVVTDLTKPSIRIGIPAGLIVVPIHVQLSVVTVAGTDDVFAVLINNADSFTTGGDSVAMLVRNALVNGTTQARSSGTVKRHYSDDAITEAALTNPIPLKLVESQGLGDPATFNPEYNILKGDPMVYVAGPASWLIYLTQETTAAEGNFCLSWAELQADTIP